MCAGAGVCDIHKQQVVKNELQVVSTRQCKREYISAIYPYPYPSLTLTLTLTLTLALTLALTLE